MAFETIIDLDTDETVALGGVNKKTGKPNPSKIEGYYIGSKTVASPKSKDGTCKLHVFQTATGNVGVWGKTDLDRKMLTVSPGLATRVEFTGMQETKNNPMYKYKVQVDKFNRIEVPGTGDSSEESSVGSYSGDDGLEDPGLDSEESSYDEPTPPRAQAPRSPARAPDAAAIAKTKALLSARK